MSSKLPLPDIFVKEFHPTKNKKLKIEDITKAYKFEVWWKCESGHEWKQIPRNRLRNDKITIQGCKQCKEAERLKKIPKAFFDYFDFKKNKNFKKNSQIKISSSTVVWWKCKKDPNHIWQQSINSRYNSITKANILCYKCNTKANLGKKSYRFYKENNFSSLFPNIYKSVIKDKKEYKISYEQIGRLSPGSEFDVWIKCPKGEDHIFKTPIARATSYSKKLSKDEIKQIDKKIKCKFCAKYTKSKTNSVSALYPKLIKYYSNTLNSEKVGDAIASHRKKFWWQCDKNKDHVFELTLSHMLRSLHANSKNMGCPYCRGSKFLENESLLDLYPEIAKQINKEKNDLDPKKINPNSSKEIYWKCNVADDHIWKQKIKYRTGVVKECPFCNNSFLSTTNSLTKIYPKFGKEFDEKKNGIKASKIKFNSGNQFWWKCLNDPNHIWKTSIQKRLKRNVNCPICKTRNTNRIVWSRSSLIAFINSIESYVSKLTASEIYLIFQQTGLPSKHSSSKKFINDYLNNKLPKEEVDKFIKKEESSLDTYFDNKNSKENIDLSEENLQEINESTLNTNFELGSEIIQDLPSVNVKDTFETLEYCIRNSDEEAVTYLLESAKNKLWKKLFDSNSKKEVINEIEKTESRDKYTFKVREEFLEEYYAAEKLVIPKSYNFRIDGKKTLPNLMQLRTASRVVKDRSVGNWSGTGAGKTLSAILASRVIDSKLTLVCCPNAVVTNWKEEIGTIFPGTYIQTKNLEYQNLQDQNQNKFLVLNFEAFQQQDSDDKVMELLENTNIEFVVIDEIHYAKQKDPEKMSKRKRIINSMIAKLRETNPKLAVLGMSATPVINNLQEGIGLIEMITGEKHDDLEPKISEENCMKLHQRLMTNGLRMKIPMTVSIDIKDDIEVDCSEYIDEFKALQNKWFPLNVEQITTRAKIKEILKHIKPKTLIYTHYRQDIDKFLYDEITKAGWSVGFHTGDDKSGIDDFKKGKLDVLIGTSTIGTGVNGLQNVCSNLIINSMPWTNAEFEQLIGRIYRQGQKNKVNVIIPLTRAEVNGQEWSWCKSRYERIKFKKTIGDAVIDGQLPNQNIRTQAQVVQDIKKWLDRLSSGEETIIERTKIKAQFIPGDKDNIKKRIGAFGDFSKMNARWYNTSSEKLHNRLSKDRVEWDHYHEMYEENRKSWTVVPIEEMIKVFSERSDYVIGDFGCGKAQIYDALKDSHEVHSFDHVAYNQNVIACDFSHTTLDNETLDHAIFCLSFMGNTIGKYLLEANRTLKLDGKIHIIEPTKTFKDIDTFEKELAGYGFGFVNINSMSDRFTYIRAEKIGEIKNPNPSIKL